MPDALDKIRTGAEKAWKKLEAQRLGGREFDVVVESYTAGNRVAGTKGTWGGAITLSPRPSVDLGEQWDMTAAGLAKIGDAKVSKISRSYTEMQLRGLANTPNRWTIAGDAYHVVELRPEPVGWVAILQRMA